MTCQPTTLPPPDTSQTAQEALKETPTEGFAPKRKSKRASYLRYTLMDEVSGCYDFVVARSEDQLRARARAWVDPADYGEVNETFWVGVMLLKGWVKEFSRDRHIGDVRVAVEPQEPKCTHPAHDWLSPRFLGGIPENPGVWGNGGGVIRTECCSHCGRYRVTDTWATDRGTGRQGLTAISYRHADENSLRWLGVVK